MKYLRIPAVCHGGAIHSLDIDFRGEKLITSGKDGVISVWLLDQFTSICKLPELSASKLEGLSPVSQVSVHQGLVNLVRFSPVDSNMFLSCDESGLLFLTDLLNESKQLYPFNQEQAVPIIDISWSKSGQFIAWSSQDGQVHLYDVFKSTYQTLSKLTHSPKLVIQRSVCFDPTDNYLVTVGDDTMIYLYQYKHDDSGYQFRLINKISKFVNKNPINIHYKRISWSPDGELFSIPTASKNQTSLISLISKSKSWENRISLVGHGLSCEVVRFNPKIFHDLVQETIPNQTENIYNIIATAGSDKTLTVWNTSKDTPIFVLKDVAEKPIVDLCWDPSGQYLMLASLDGHLGIVGFEELELGKQISTQVWEQLKNFQKDLLKPLNFKYDQDQPSNNRKSNQQSIELLDQKDAIDPTKEEKVAKTVLKKPDESLANGKDDEVNEKPVIGDIVPELPKAGLPDEKHDDILHSAMNTRKAKVTKPVTKTASTKATTETQKITTKNGKRRIQPLLISNSSNNNIQKENGTSSEASAGISAGNSHKSLMEYDKPSYSVSDDVQKQFKRYKVDESSNKKIKRELEPVKFVGSVILNPNTAFSKVRLAVPKVRMGFQIASKIDDDSFVLDIKNGIGNETKPSRITYFKKEKQIWTDFVPRFIQLAVEGSNFWALTTSDGQILTYSHSSGKRLLPPIILGSPISFLESHSSFLMVVTCVGELNIWDLEKKKNHLSTNISPLLELSNKYQEDGLSKSDNITMCSVTSAGIPIVTLSNGSGYLYNKDLETWQTITESWWSFGSHYWDSTEDNSYKLNTSTVQDGEVSIVELLEHKTNEEIIRRNRTGRGKYFNKISKNMIMKEGFENLENTISLSHLENRILCCELLGDFKDFHTNFITYAKRLCELGLKTKLYEICEQLLGPSSDTDDDQQDSKWVPQVCGYEKHALLKEVIYACSKHRDAQRILIHFGKKVGIVDSLV